MFIETIPVKIAGDPFFLTNCYIVTSSPESDCVIVIDPGDEPERIKERIGTRTLTAIVLTHGHFDHVGGIVPLSKHSSAKIYAHKDDANWINESFDAIRDGYARFVEGKNEKRGDSSSPNLTAEAPSIDVTLVEGDILDICGLSFLVMHTPGHSPGSMCLYNVEEGILFSGDTLFQGTCGRTDFIGGNSLLMHSSLARLAALPPEIIVYPGHNNPTTIGEEIHRGLSEY